MRLKKLAASTVALVFISVAWAGAQTETGRISGRVVDEQGGAIPGVNVTATSVATGASRSTVTDGTGGYVIASVLPATYDVSFQLQGFRTASTRVQVPVGADVAADATLQVGGVTETVAVTATVERVNVRTAEISTTISQQQIAELPTLTRDPYDLIAVAGNVNDQDPTIYGGDTPRGVKGYSINGLRSTATNALLDGSANNDEFTGSIGQSVPLDSVQEFSVISSNFSAQFGRASAGIVNVATKTGTNELRGTGYEFFRNEKLATRTVDQKARDIEKSPFDRHQVGYSLGGPIRKNSAFFFSSLEYTRVRSNQTDITLVPTAEFLARTGAATRGFFDKFPLSTGINGPLVMRSELAGSPSGAFNALPANLPIFGEVRRQSPIDAGGGDPQNTYTFVGRVDWTLGTNSAAYVRYALEKQDLFAGTVSTSPYAGFDTGEQKNNQNILFSFTSAMSNRLTSQSKVVFNRLYDAQPLSDTGAVPTLFMQTRTTTINSIRVALPGYLPFSPGSGIPFGGPQKLLQLYNDMTWFAGTHDLRFGGSFVHIMDDRTFGAYQTAAETLGNNLAQALDNLVTGNLYQFQFVLDPQGKFPGDQISLPARAPSFTRNNRYNEWAAYANDAWSFRPNMTLNLGVRYEYYGVQQNTDPSLDSNFYYGTGSNIWERIKNGSVQVAPNSPVGGLWKPDKNNFAPRLGWAWDIKGDGSTALRAGYGMAFERNFGNVTFNVIQNPPNQAVALYQAGVDVPTIAITTDNLGPFSAPTGTVTIPRTSLRHVDENITNAYAHFWSAAYAQQLRGRSTASIEYTGSAGENQYLIISQNGAGSAANYLNDPDPRARLLPQYNNINSRTNGGISRYNGVTFGLENRGVGESGLSFTARYTLARAKDELSSTFSESANNANLGLLDPYNPKLDYSYADYDVRHRFSIGGIWEIPVGRNSGGVVKQVVSGWQAAFIYTAQSGTPFTMYDCSNSIVAFCPRMLQVSGTALPGKGPGDPPSTGDPNNYTYFDFSNQLPLVGSYVNPKTGTSDFGPFPSNMTERNIFRRPGKWNLDAVFSKRFRFSNTKAVQARIEMYNVFAHANLYIDSASNDISAGPIVTAFRGYVAPLQGAPQGDGQRRVQLAVKFEF